MIHVVTFKWKPHAGYRSVFGAETVNTTKRMVDRWYPDPHLVWCITDDPSGIDADVSILPLWDDYATIPSPHGGKNPSCYRRLKLYAPEMASLIGERMVSLDLDAVITGDLRPLWNRPEDIVFWGDTHPRTYYNGSMTLMTAGCRPQVWQRFDPRESPHKAKAAGQWGSDQGWISYCLGPKEAKWGKADGVYSYRNHISKDNGRLPDNARIVLFHGSTDPWSPRVSHLDWIKRHYYGVRAEVAA